MVKAKVIGKIKPETIVCLHGKNNLYLVEDDKCHNKEYESINPEIGDTIYFDEWFWTGNIVKLTNILIEIQENFQ